MVKYIYIFIIGIICNSCGFFIVPKHVKQNFTYCYDGLDTGIDSLINIEGYYDFTSKDCPSCYIRIMFYKDGTCVIGSFYSKGESVQSYFENIVNHDPKGLYYFHKYKDWGCYIIKGDTIKLQKIDRPVGWESDARWFLEEIWYKILDNKTIVGICPSKRPSPYSYDSYEDSYMSRYGVPAKFTHLTVRPDSNCSLKQKKWFWCSEEDWAEYKIQLKKNKKNK